MIQGLGVNEAVKSGSSLMVCLEPLGEYLVDGKKIRIGYTPSPFCIEEGVEIVKVKAYPKVISEYVNGDLKQLSTEEFNKRMRELKSPYYDEDGDFIKYPDLDTEFRVRKAIDELNQYKPVYYQQADEHIPVEIKIVGEVTPTGSKLIEGAYSIGKAKFTNGNFYKVNLSGAVADETWKFIDEHNLREFVINPPHTNIRYLQIKGNYVMPDGLEGVRDGCLKYCSTLKDAQKIEAEARNTIRRHLELKVTPETLDKVTSGQIYSELLSLYDVVGELDVKTKSQGNWNSARKKIKELIDVLRS